jgi:hypothetical protein
MPEINIFSGVTAKRFRFPLKPDFYGSERKPLFRGAAREKA